MAHKNRVNGINRDFPGSDVRLEEGQLKNGKALIAGDGNGLRHFLVSGAQWLKLHLEDVNQLNVFPVPDGDTGTNMALTILAAVNEANKVSSVNAGEVASAAAHGALMEARGNSGIILSQLLQGMAGGLKGKVEFSTLELAQAVELGVELAYQSVVNPVEGTILTVANAAADAAKKSARRGETLNSVLEKMVEAARFAQADTPRLLPVLKEAGVTDSGGQGFLYILEGGLRYLHNLPVDQKSDHSMGFVNQPLTLVEAYPAYDVQFLIKAKHLDLTEIRACVDAMGQSAVVVGDEHIVKVHVHVEDPAVPLNYGAGLGQISDVVVENLHQQVEAFVGEQASAPTTGIEILPVVEGAGFINIFRSLGVEQIINGGQTVNPGVQDILFSIEQAKVENVLILPNNSHVISTAQQALALTGKNVKVLPTQSIPQGIASLLAFNAEVGLDVNVQRMMNAAGQVESIEIAKAVNNTQLDGFNILKDQFIGFVNGRVSGVGWVCQEVVLSLLAQTTLENFEIITIYYGESCTANRANALVNKLVKQYPLVDVEIYNGGQPLCQYIISLE